MPLYNDCNYDETLVPPDMACNLSIAGMIEKIHYTLPGYPIVLPVATAAETALDPDLRDAARLTRALATRLISTGPDKIFTIDIYNGQMPFSSPSYKLNPQTGSQHLDEAKTDMRVEFTDYRANLLMYRFWRKLASGQQRLFFFENQGQLWGGLAGIKASVTAIAGVIDGQEVSNQVRMSINWRGHPMPIKAMLAA